MPDPKTGAKEEAPPPSETESAKLAASLKAAQDSAEAARKQNEELQSQLEEKDEKITEFESKLKEFESNQNDNGKKAKSPTELAATLRKQAEAGDINAIAVLEAAREDARKVAKEEFRNAHDAEKLRESESLQEEFLAQKCKERGWTRKQFIENVDEYGRPYQHLLPHLLMQNAWEDMLRDEGWSVREAAIKAKEIEMGLWKDSGTNGDAPGDKGKKPDEKPWRDDKTPDQKRSRLAEL